MAFEDIHRPLTAAGFSGAIKWIIIISGIVLILQQFFGGPIIVLFGLIPQQVIGHLWLWQLLTYMFLHGGLFHWLFNMFILWMFGRELEVRWGTPFFLFFFFLCGLGAALCVLAISPHSQVPTIGASGGIFGLLAAFAVVFPEAVLYLYFIVPVKAWQAVILFAVIELLFASGEGVARFAHLGGMATGYLYLRSEDYFRIHAHSFFRRLGGMFHRDPSSKRQKSVTFHEVTDDLVKEVDRILEKILKEGIDSLTPKEKEIMERYSKLKH